MRGEEEESAGGHYVTAGAALIGLGAVGLLVAIMGTLVWHVELRFIDGRAMGLTSFGFIALGGWMVRRGRELSGT